MSDDFYLNLLDWGKRNVLAFALGYSVYLWDASVRSVSEFAMFDDDLGPVISVGWAPDGQRIAIGLDSSHVQLWEATTNRGSILSTNRGSILSTGGLDGKIVNSDVRIRSHIVQTYAGHRMEVCGLKWSGSGQQLASGGNDDLVHVWDRSMARSASASNQCQWLHRFDEHRSAVKALAWCPFQSNILASGGGESDGCIRFWNTLTGACLRSVDTGSHVCGLIWSKNERELLSSHGLSLNQLALWRYPFMVKMDELTGHPSRVLFMAQSPDGSQVASAAGDETSRFWKGFETSKVENHAAKGAITTPFASFSGVMNIR